jgi:hypothetical protein
MYCTIPRYGEKENLMDYSNAKIKSLNIKEDLEAFVADKQANGDYNDTVFKLPAANKDLFGYITPETHLSLFEDVDHTPYSLNVKDTKLKAYNKNAKVVAIENQFNRYGYPVKVKAALVTELPLKFYQFDFIKPEKVNNVYEDLVEVVDGVVEALSGKLKTQMEKQYQARIDAEIMFKTNVLETINHKGQKCTWAWLGTKRHKQKLILTGIDGKSYINFTYQELLDAAGDMAHDECLAKTSVLLRFTTECD